MADERDASVVFDGLRARGLVGAEGHEVGAHLGQALAALRAVAPDPAPVEHLEVLGIEQRDEVEPARVEKLVERVPRALARQSEEAAHERLVIAGLEEIMAAQQAVLAHGHEADGDLPGTRLPHPPPRHAPRPAITRSPSLSTISSRSKRTSSDSPNADRIVAKAGIPLLLADRDTAVVADDEVRACRARWSATRRSLNARVLSRNRPLDRRHPQLLVARPARRLVRGVEQLDTGDAAVAQDDDPVDDVLVLAELACSPAEEAVAHERDVTAVVDQRLGARDHVRAERDHLAADLGDRVCADGVLPGQLAPVGHDEVLGVDRSAAPPWRGR